MIFDFGLLLLCSDVIGVGGLLSVEAPMHWHLLLCFDWLVFSVYIVESTFVLVQ